jgi:hypothetical protein
MLHYANKHLIIKSQWMTRKHKNKRIYYKWLRKTEKAWKQFLKADKPLTLEDKDWFMAELVKISKEKN